MTKTYRKYSLVQQDSLRQQPNQHKRDRCADSSHLRCAKGAHIDARLLFENVASHWCNARPLRCRRLIRTRRGCYPDVCCHGPKAASTHPQGHISPQGNLTRLSAVAPGRGDYKLAGARQSSLKPRRCWPVAWLRGPVGRASRHLHGLVEANVAQCAHALWIVGTTIIGVGFVARGMSLVQGSACEGPAMPNGAPGAQSTVNSTALVVVANQRPFSLEVALQCAGHSHCTLKP